MENILSQFCPNCGVRDNGDGTCQDFFHSFLNLEFSDPAYGKVHALTVGTFMIQHDHYSENGLKWIKENLKRYIDEGLDSHVLRKSAMRDLNQDKRKPKIIKDPGLPTKRIKWKMTIADVARNFEDAESYLELITLWTKRTLQQLDENGL